LTTINCRFGFDLDNTLIDYSDAIKKYCVQNRIEPQESLSSLRKVLKNFDTSDKDWQCAQSWLYTSGLEFAKLSSGSVEICNYLTKLNYQLFIISHKTKLTPGFTGSLNLHKFAIEWIENCSLAKQFKIGHNMFFTENRRQKIRKITELHLTYFVDDLEEVLTDAEFPKGTLRLLLSNDTSSNPAIQTIGQLGKIKEIIQHELR
jgi:hypothetical protein